MKALITAAQAGDKAALLQLCADFKPLLKSEARREMFYRSLGKDAEGIAVLAFIELVLQYKGADFENWPGLARCKVHFAVLTRCISRAELGKRSPDRYGQRSRNRPAGDRLCSR